MAHPHLVVPLIATCGALLLTAAISDMRSRTISNGLNVAVMMLAIPFWLAVGLAPFPDMAWQLVLGLAFFLPFLALYALGGMGAGDVKFVGALALWVPWHLALPFAVIIAATGGILSMWLVIRRRIDSSASVEVPYGVPIAIAGFWALHQQYLNHFGFNQFA